MSTGALLAELRRLGIEIEADGDRLRYAGPEGAISPELLERLKAHKADLIAVCRKTNVRAGEGRNLAESACMRAASDPEVRKLLAAGCEPKERCGKLIWRHPDDGFYYSQEMAAHFLERKRR
jgi:tubulysin polyketide synthase-like protein